MSQLERLLKISVSVKIENKRFIEITALTITGCFQVQCESYSSLEDGFKKLVELTTNDTT